LRFPEPFPLPLPLPLAAELVAVATSEEGGVVVDVGNAAVVGGGRDAIV